MNEILSKFLIGIFLGILAAVIIAPVSLFAYETIKKLFLRRKIAKMLKKREFLEPLDKKDYDYKAWTGKKYGNIDFEKNEQELKRINEKIFGIKKENGSQ